MLNFFEDGSDNSFFPLVGAVLCNQNMLSHFFKVWFVDDKPSSKAAVERCRLTKNKR